MVHRASLVRQLPDHAHQCCGAAGLGRCDVNGRQATRYSVSTGSVDAGTATPVVGPSAGRRRLRRSR